MKLQLTDVRGIGPSTAQALEARGIRSVAALAKASVEKVVAAPGFGKARAADVIAAAAALLPAPSAPQPAAPKPASSAGKKKLKVKKPKAEKDKGKTEHVMAHEEIFISYARDDRLQAQRLAEALEAQGWSVWWDRIIPAGRTFDDVIEEAIDSARCVIVLWSKASVGSRWVRTEAGEGAAREVLVPILIEETKIPLAFRRIQTADLTRWDGNKADQSFRRLTADIAELIGPPPKVPEG